MLTSKHSDTTENDDGCHVFCSSQIMRLVAGGGGGDDGGGGVGGNDGGGCRGGGGGLRGAHIEGGAIRGGVLELTMEKKRRLRKKTKRKRKCGTLLKPIFLTLSSKLNYS